MCIRDRDYPYAEADHIAKLVPEGPKMALAQALELSPELRELEGANERNRELFDVARRLEGLSRHASTHAAGIVIGREDLMNYVPLYRDPKTGSVSTQITMDHLEDCGLVKMDFLGLKTLTIVEKTCAMIRAQGTPIDITQIPDDDQATFSLLGEGKSTCVFQFESSGMQDILRRAKPASIDDLSDLNALYRPGPMENIDQYIDAKMGRKSIQYPLPELEPVLKETYGVITYQEQVMQIARLVAGYSLGQADILRKAMGKKKKEVMDEQKKRFIQGAIEKGYSKKVATRIFDLFVPFAGYGFNKCHSAPYSLVAYRTAYLKANHPAEFMAANLTSEIHNTDKLAQYMSEARSMGIKILPPDINLSEKEFTVKDGRIVYGLCGVKNVGSTAVDVILSEREVGGPFKGIHDLLERIDLKTVNRKVVESLILTGVLDSFGEGRATLFHNLPKILERAIRVKESRAFGQKSLFDGLQLPTPADEPLEKVEEWPTTELLKMERQNLGFYFSGHPLDQVARQIEECVNLSLTRLDSASPERSYTVIGVVKELKEIITRTGKKMAFAVLESYESDIELVVFPEPFEKFRPLLEQDRIVGVQGKLDKSRGDPKFLVDLVVEPNQLKPVRHSELHIRLSEELGEETNLYNLRDLIFDQPGECSLYLHVAGNNAGREWVIKASPAITVSADETCIHRMLSNPQVKEVWKE